MSLFFNQIITFLTVPPGNVIYHIVVIISIAGVLQGAIRLLRNSQFPQARRAVLGLGILLGLQFVLFLASWLSLKSGLDAQTVLPPLDRAVTLLSLIWITWLWSFPEPLRLADAATVLLNLLTITLFSLTLVSWAHNPHIGFNTSIFEMTWQGFTLAVVLLGLVVLFMRKPNGWSNGLAMLLLAFVGHLVSLIWPSQGDFSGFLRLTQIAMFPILITLLRRFPGPETVRKQTLKAEQLADEPIPEPRRYSTDPKTVDALMSLAAEVNADQIGRAITRGIAQAMLADLCFLITIAQDKKLVIACGYDLIREESLDGTKVDNEAIPLLANAILHGQSLRLPASSTSSDLKGLGAILGLSNPGHLLCVPIASRERGPLGAILILSPNSNRLWNAEDQAFLTNVSTRFIPILERGQRATLLETERDLARQSELSAQEQAAQAKTQYDTAIQELERQRETASQSQGLIENMAALQVTLKESQKTIEALQAEIERLDKARESERDVASSQLEIELRKALEENASMQKALASANSRVIELEQRRASSITTEQVDVIASLSQELRQTMSSIVGYTDLLLGESVGLLGAVQRKFIELIKASTDRIGSLVDDLIHVTDLENEKMKILTEPSDMNRVIPVLERGQRATPLETEVDQARQSVLSAQEQVVQAKTKYDTAIQELERQRETASQSEGLIENMAALQAVQKESQKTIEALQAEIERLHKSSESGHEENPSQLELELRQALEEMARMQNALASANSKVIELEQRPASPITTEQLDVIASISQELRQPMSSIVGYTDLLLGESVGLLGALQRKFIERIKASTERIGGLVDDLIQITNLEAGKMEFRTEPIDLNLIIDNAMAYTGTQIREKNITLRLDIPDASPRIRTDRDALEQMLIHLLQNATNACQVEGVITLRVQMQSDVERHFISIQVTDTGGGILPADISRVFARRYRAEYPLIQGLGDTGVGLSIAKTLVEAQGGRIWVDTKAGSGSTFSILLPVMIEAEEEQ